MNRGSRPAALRSGIRRRCFNEAPIHESGKLIHSEVSEAAQIVLQ